MLIYWINLNAVNGCCFNLFLQTSLECYRAFLYRQRLVNMWDLKETFEQRVFCFKEGYIEYISSLKYTSFKKIPLVAVFNDDNITVSEDDTIQPGNTKALQLFRKAEVKLLVVCTLGDCRNCRLFCFHWGMASFILLSKAVWYWCARWYLTRIWLHFKIKGRNHHNSLKIHFTSLHCFGMPVKQNNTVTYILTQTLVQFKLCKWFG